MNSIRFKFYYIAICLSFSTFSFGNYSYMYELDDYNDYLMKVLKNTVVIDFNNANNSTIKSQFSSSSGTSAYLKYQYDNYSLKSTGAILSKAEATSLLGEIVSYKLAILLNVDQIYSAKTLIKITGRGLKTYKSEIKKLQKHISGKRGMLYKKKNVKNILSFIKTDHMLWGALAPWGHRPYSWDSLIDENHPLRKAIQANKKQPDRMTDKEIKEFKSKKYKTKLKKAQINPTLLAKELSSHFIIDLLVGQYDRFSGGNLQYFIDNNGEIHIGAFDNGGTFAWTQKRLKRYFKFVTRFEKPLVAKLRKLNNFLKGKKSRYGEFEDKNNLFTFLEIGANAQIGGSQLDSTAYIRTKLKETLQALIFHIEKTCRKYGTKKCYFRN